MSPNHCVEFFQRMLEVSLANSIGPDACWLLTAVAAKEQDTGDTPVLVFDGEAMPLFGCKSLGSLHALRELCIEAGWLTYEAAAAHGGKYATRVPTSEAVHVDQ
jgi:hypothetical protein